MDWQDLAWLVPVGLVSGAVNTVAGGGSFVTLSALIWLGLPATEANATNRVGVLFQSGASAARFRSDGIDGGPDLPGQLAVTGAGSALGAGLSLLLDPQAFERALGIAMVVMLGVSLARPGSWSEPRPARPIRWLLLLLTGIYGGFVQAGVGVLILPCLVLLGGLDPVRANARKSVLVAAFTVPALALYAATGLVDWAAGAVLAVSSALGGLLGARLTVGYGPTFVWATLVAVVAVSAVRLIL